MPEHSNKPGGEKDPFEIVKQAISFGRFLVDLYREEPAVKRGVDMLFFRMELIAGVAMLAYKAVGPALGLLWYVCELNRDCLGTFFGREWPMMVFFAAAGAVAVIHSLENINRIYQEDRDAKPKK